jgi:hypothetical protein
MQHLEVSGTPVLYIGRRFLKVKLYHQRFYMFRCFLHHPQGALILRLLKL